jgi:hypothetical protein
VRARHYYQLAAQQGDAEAQFHLGRMDGDGDGGEKSDDRAIEWFTRYAENEGSEDSVFTQL